MPTATVAGGDIHYSMRGAGNPLALLLPQSAGPVGVAPFIDGLAKFSVPINYDQRGTGKSPAPTEAGAISIPDRAQEVAGLLDALEIERASLFCHSTGCGIGIAFAAAYPDRLDRLILASPWSYGDPYLTGMQNLRIAAARALGAADYARFNASLLFPPDYRRAHAAGFTQQYEQAKPPNVDEISMRLSAILAFDSRPLTPQINQPALIVTGADDQLMSAWFGEDIAATMPKARYKPLTGGGHMLPETRTAELLSLIGAFLQDDL